MSEIQQTLDMPEYVSSQLQPDVARWIESVLKSQQQQIFHLRQFLEPAIKLNSGAPNQVFNPLE